MDELIGQLKSLVYPVGNGISYSNIVLLLGDIQQETCCPDTKHLQNIPLCTVGQAEHIVMIH